MDKIELELGTNGIIATHKTDSINEEGVTVTNKYVFEENCGNHNFTEGLPEQKALQECFLFIKEAFGIFYSKHNKTKLDISIINQNTGEKIE